MRSIVYIKAKFSEWVDRLTECAVCGLRSECCVGQPRLARLACTDTFTTCAGGVLGIVAGVGMGVYASHRLRRRVVFLETVGRLLQTLWQEMSYTAQPLDVLWLRLADYEGFSACSLVRDTARGLPHTPFAIAFSEAAKAAEEEGLVSPAVCCLLTEFAAGCGRTDLEGQRAHIAHYRALLSAQEADCRRLWQEKGRVYRVLGLTGGVALTLLLM